MARTARTARTTRRLGVLAATALLGTSLAACSGYDESAADSPSADSSVQGDDLPDWAPQILVDDEGDVTGLDFSDVDPAEGELLIAEVTTGDGPDVEAGQTITADYYGQLADADSAFDSSFGREPFEAPIAAGRLIKGWDQGLVGVPVGSRVIMSVPPELGYGEAGAPPSIPGGATLYFVIDIIEAE